MVLLLGTLGKSTKSVIDCSNFHSMSKCWIQKLEMTYLFRYIHRIYQYYLIQSKEAL